jgi:putative ABC transport system permease protein
MSFGRQLARGLRALFHRRMADADLADEVRDYFERVVAERVSGGQSPDEARRGAMNEIGNLTVTRERVRAYGWENAVETFWGDLHYAARRLRHNPGFAATSVITLALGIGAATAIFSAVNPILFEPLPYPDARRVTAISDLYNDGSHLEVTFGTYREVAVRSASFDASAVYRAWLPTFTGASEPERLEGQRVSAGYFRSLGVPPALGRDFTEDDDRWRGPPNVIVSDGFWRRRLGGDTSIVGRMISLDDNAYTVVGVMPAAFENVPAPSAEIWAPLQYDASLPADGREWGHHLRMIGRLKPNVPAERARRELALIARTPVKEFARPQWARVERGFSVNTLQAEVSRGVRPALLAIIGAVLLVLMIACVNVTNLLLARGAQRRGELAMRVALGAGRSRLVRQLLTESVMLAMVGGMFGVAVAGMGVRALAALAPPGLPRVEAIHLDAATLAFALVVTTVVGIGVGLIPAIDASRSDLNVTIQLITRRTVGTRRLTRGALVVAEVALALVLLVAAGLVLRSVNQMLAVKPGFDPTRLLTMQVQVATGEYRDNTATFRFFEQALDAVQQVPGVESAALTSQLPLSGNPMIYGVSFESTPQTASVPMQGAFRNLVTPGYFGTMRIPLRQGRVLDARDVAGAPPAVVLNESFARRVFPGENPIGKRLHVGDTDRPPFTVVGVVGDVKQTSLAADAEDAVYLTPGQWFFAEPAHWVVVRARGEPAALTAAVKRAVWSVGRKQPIVRVSTMPALVERTAAERRFVLLVLESFALAALALAAVGIYGVIAGSVTERTREIGVRSALGASPRDILGLVLRQGMRLTVLGVVIGVGGAVLASRLIVTMLFGVSRLDPATYVGVVVLLSATSILACWLPAWRAARVEPSITLRAE